MKVPSNLPSRLNRRAFLESFAAACAVGSPMGAWAADIGELKHGE